MTDNSTQPIEYMLTTVDNPFNPFTRFDEWLAYDIGLGYNSSAFLDRVAYVSNELSEADQTLAIQNAIDEIVKENVSGMHRKVSRTSANDLEV
jgi:hypothetical protein